MTDIIAFDMSRYQRIIDTADTRVRGSFVLHGERAKTIWIKAHEVTIYDEGHSYGLVYGSFDLSGSVSGETVEVDWDRIPESKRVHALEVLEEMERVFRLLALAFEGGYRSQISESGTRNKPGIDPESVERQSQDSGNPA